MATDNLYEAPRVFRPGMITIVNAHADPTRIVATDFWRSEAAARGYAYLSLVPGCARLLVPPRMEQSLLSALPVRAVWICRGSLPYYTPANTSITLEHPYLWPSDLFLADCQVDAPWPKLAERETWQFAVYTSISKVREYSRCWLVRGRLPYWSPSFAAERRLLLAAE